MPVNVGSGVDAVFAHREGLWSGTSSRKKQVGELISRAIGESATGIDPRLIGTTIVVFDLRVGAVESADFEGVVAAHVAQVVLNRVEVFMVGIRSDIPNSLGAAVGLQSAPS